MSDSSNPVEEVPTAEFSRPGPTLSSPDSPCLVVISSTTPGAFGSLYRLSGGEAVIGRGRDVELCLEDHGISRRHAQVSAGESGKFQLKDLGSRNGTYLNGARVSQSALKEGDQIQVGSSTLLRFSLRAELRESETRLRQALAVGRVGTWDWDAVGGQVVLSGSLEKIFRTLKGLHSLSTDAFIEMVHPEDRDRLRIAISRALMVGEGMHQEFRAVWRDGTVRWIEAQGQVIRDSFGKGVRITGVLIDSSARKAVEQSLLRQLKTLESLYDSGMLLDPEGRILDWNESAEAMFGFSKAEALGRLPFQLLRIHESDQRARSMRDTLSRAGRWTDEVTVLRRDGVERVCEVVVVPLRGDGDDEASTVAYVSVYRDITERKQMEARLLLADRMASLGTLAAGVAHEINNPLAYVIANLSFVNAELAALKKAPRGLEEVVEAVREAQEGVGRINAIVRDLKTFSREDQGAEKGSSQCGVDLVVALELAAKMAKNEIRHRAQLIQELRPVPKVRGTESRLGQVFLNLLINAAQAIPEGSASHHRISISSRHAPGDGWVTVEISDTGVGISKEDSRRIFDPFFTTKPVGVGTGLGLSICHSLVTGLGGEIEVESEPGHGATFRVRLPVSDEATDDVRGEMGPQPSAPNNVRSLHRARILVVDDEPLVGNSIRRALGREHEVLAVSTGADALRLFRSGKRFDLILCDVMMPEMTGMDLSAMLTELAPDQAERMVFMTGGAFTDRAKRFLERTPRRTLLKPLEPPVLRSLIHEALGPG